MLTLDFSHIRLACLIAWFSEQDQKSCSGKSGTTSQPDIRLCLIDQAHARSKSGGSLIDQAAAWSKSGMPDIRQTSQPDQSCSGKSGDQANEGNSWEVYTLPTIFLPYKCFPHLTTLPSLTLSLDWPGSTHPPAATALVEGEAKDRLLFWAMLHSWQHIRTLQRTAVFVEQPLVLPGSSKKHNFYIFYSFNHQHCKFTTCFW